MTVCCDFALNMRISVKWDKKMVPFVYLKSKSTLPWQVGNVVMERNLGISLPDKLNFCHEKIFPPSWTTDSPCMTRYLFLLSATTFSTLKSWLRHHLARKKTPYNYVKQHFSNHWFFDIEPFHSATILCVICTQQSKIILHIIKQAYILPLVCVIGYMRLVEFVKDFGIVPKSLRNP